MINILILRIATSSEFKIRRKKKPELSTTRATVDTLTSAEILSIEDKWRSILPHRMGSSNKFGLDMLKYLRKSQNLEKRNKFPR